MRVMQLTARPRPCLAPLSCRRCPHRPVARVRAASGDSEAEALPAGLTAQQVCLGSHGCAVIKSIGVSKCTTTEGARFEPAQNGHDDHCTVLLTAVQAYEVLGLPNEGHTFEQVGVASRRKPWVFSVGF
jgi:hypothetical protein